MMLSVLIRPPLSTPHAVVQCRKKSLMKRDASSAAADAGKLVAGSVDFLQRRLTVLRIW